MSDGMRDNAKDEGSGIWRPKRAEPAQGQKFDSEKIRPGLIPPECLKAIAEIMTFGADKYSADNWKLVDPDKYVDALWRHYIAWKTGEDKDAESGLAHVAHFATNAVFLLWFEIENNKKEDEK